MKKGKKLKLSFGLPYRVKEQDNKDLNCNPKQYNINTVSDLMQVVTTENVKRLVADIENMLTIHALLKEALIENGLDASLVSELKYNQIVWVDDFIYTQNTQK